MPYEATVSKIQEVVDGYPGLKRDLLTYLKEAIKEVLTGSGGSIVVIPAILYFAFTGHWIKASFLLFWALVIGGADNVLRPILTARHAEVSTLALFIGAIGGAAAFGILGLVLGPVLVSFVVFLARFSQESPPTDA